MSKYLLEDNGATRTEMWFDDFDNSFTFTEIQDVTQILEDSKRKFNDFGDKRTPGKMGDWHHTHSIPKVIYQKGGWMYMVEKDPAVLASYLNDPDYSYFRVAPTKI